MHIGLGRGLLPDTDVQGCLSLSLFFFFFFLFKASPAAYGGSQARGLLRARAAGPHHSHSNAGSRLCLRPTPQLMARPDP